MRLIASSEVINMPILGVDGNMIPDEYMPQITGARRKYLHPNAKIYHYWADGTFTDTIEGHSIPDDHPVWADIGRMIRAHREANGRT